MLLDYFDMYVRMGLMPIALYPNSKRPVGNLWNQDWSVDRWRPFFEKDSHGIGILLGNVVDVEGDTSAANDILERMIDGAERPMYRSSKSVHNLFINPDPALTRLCVNGIEFRGRSHMSVVPPSTHADGSCYRWIKGSCFRIGSMPEELERFYFRNRKVLTPSDPADRPGRKTRRSSGGKKTRCNGCCREFCVNRTRLVLEVRAFRSLGSLWLCRGCRRHDIRQLCRDARNGRLS